MGKRERPRKGRMMWGWRMMRDEEEGRKKIERER
jgi:hypothetical protein